MKIVSGLIWGVFIFMTGCSIHHYKVEGPEVSLYLNKPDISQVQFACSLNDYELRSLRKIGRHWVVTLPADAAFRYFYIIDGSAFLPPCRLKEKDDFGSENCIFEPGL